MTIYLKYFYNTDEHFFDPATITFCQSTFDQNLDDLRKFFMEDMDVNQVDVEVFVQNEFNKIWEAQKQHYPELLTDELKEQLKGKNKSQTWTICQKAFNIEGIKRDTKGIELKKEKDKLDLGLITEDEFNKRKEDLMKYIK